MIKSDFHTHTEFSSDSDAPMEDMVKKAISLGFEKICFTDHMDYDYPPIVKSYTSDDFLDFLFNPIDYQKKLRTLQAKYKNEIQILCGIELGLQPQIQNEIKVLLSNFSFDFIIGSSHLLYGEDPYYQSFWEGLKNKLQLAKEDSGDRALVTTAIRDYFQSIYDNVKVFPQIQVYGHLDYIVRYAPQKELYYQVANYIDQLTILLKEIIQQGKGIEVNTSGLKSGLTYPNPHIEILKLYKELGGTILTIGSDAHEPSYIGYKFDSVRDLLQSVGFRYYTTFQEQKPEFHLL